VEEIPLAAEYMTDQEERKMADIKKFAVEETGILPLRGPDRQPLIGDDKQPMTVTLYSPGSKQYARAQAVRGDRLMNKIMKGSSEAAAALTELEEAQLTESKAREQVEFLVRITKEFSSNVDYDGLKGSDLARAIYSDITIGYIAEDVTKHLGVWANFYKGSSIA
jgi:hypothetical protein